MSTKSIIVAIFALALVFGVVASGCNRNRDNSVASAKTRRQSSKKHELSSVRNVRPAEVLSASAYRPPVRRKRQPPESPRRQPTMYNNYNNTNGYYTAPYQQQQPAYSSASYQVAQAYEPLPEPVPVSQLNNTGTASFIDSGTSYYTTTPASYNYAQPEYYTNQTTNNRTNTRYGDLPEYAYKPSRPDRAAYAPPPPMVARPQSPDLAMARAHLSPLPVPQTQTYAPSAPAAPVMQNNTGRYNYNLTPVPPVEPSQFSAPLPELEPVRYQRVANTRTSHAPRQVPQVPVVAPGQGWQQQQQPQQQQAQFRQLQPVGGFGGDIAQAERTAFAPMEQTRQDTARDWVGNTAATSMYW